MKDRKALILAVLSFLFSPTPDHLTPFKQSLKSVTFSGGLSSRIISTFKDRISVKCPDSYTEKTPEFSKSMIGNNVVSRSQFQQRQPYRECSGSLCCCCFNQLEQNTVIIRGITKFVKIKKNLCSAS